MVKVLGIYFIFHFFASALCRLMWFFCLVGLFPKSVPPQLRFKNGLLLGHYPTLRTLWLFLPPNVYNPYVPTFLLGSWLPNDPSLTWSATWVFFFVSCKLGSVVGRDNKSGCGGGCSQFYTQKKLILYLYPNIKISVICSIALFFGINEIRRSMKCFHQLDGEWYVMIPQIIAIICFFKLVPFHRISFGF
jgi:hypothetical protein